MGFLSSTSSVSRYYIEGKFDDAITAHVENGLSRYAIPDTEENVSDISIGWVPFENPYIPDFSQYGFTFGPYFLFSLRVDKKNIPSKLVQKHVAIETAKRIEKSGRSFLSKNEKAQLKEAVIEQLTRKMPSIPNIYNVLWHYETATLLFFSTQKAANELFETLFLKTFDLKIVRLFPYTMVEKRCTLSDTQKDIILNQPI